MKTFEVIQTMNLRRAPGTAQTVDGTLYRGARFQSDGERIEANGYKWLRVGNARLYIADSGVKEIADDHMPPPVDPLPTPVLARKSVGVHVAGSGNYGDIVGVAKRAAEAGSPIPLVVIVNHTGLGEEIKRVSPSTITVFRHVFGTDDPSPFGQNEYDNGWADGRAWFERMWTYHSQARGIDFHQMYNECSFGGNGQSTVYAARVRKFEIELMERANEQGVKVTIGNYMPGVPEQRHIEELKPALAFAEAHGHALCYHAYTDASNDIGFESNKEWFALRWVNWVAAYPKLQVILGESGFFNSPRFRGVNHMLRAMAELDSLLKPLRNGGRKVAAAWWTISGQLDRNWQYDDFTPSLPAYEKWLKG